MADATVTPTPVVVAITGPNPSGGEESSARLTRIATQVATTGTSTARLTRIATQVAITQNESEARLTRVFIQVLVRESGEGWDVIQPYGV